MNPGRLPGEQEEGKEAGGATLRKRYAKLYDSRLVQVRDIQGISIADLGGS